LHTECLELVEFARSETPRGSTGKKGDRFAG